eukprot:TRINITY_DN11143_c0_g1_i1.p1 TRINITY_DN11143_c0_g1~~TRINITY_DN11143_c0_g1_i1.p1  ORF type:complete len:1114 (+),score=420.43 TRINITY_DN11143_c0_g1_i1:88-3429(+)
MTSVAQIVRNIIDSLSDGVSELVLTVVVLAEQNAPVPDALPDASMIVNNTANTLANIARNLAKTDYADFPEISTEINEASDAVDAATSTMQNAINDIQGNGDRKQGWNGLVDACRIMSGKTIRLLQIVYGADLKRLQLSADRLTDDIDSLGPTNLSDPRNHQKFANDMGGLAQKALKLQNLLKDKANEQESPFARDLLNKIAGGLRDRTQDLINAGNAALANPELAPQVDDALQKLKDEIARAKQALNDTAPEEPKSLQNLKRLDPFLDKAEKSVADLPDVVRKNPAAYERAEKEAKDNVQEVLRQIKPNPKLKRDADKIEEDLKNQILAARNALRNPNNPAANKDLDKATDALLNALNNLRKTNPDNKLTPQQRDDFRQALDNLRNNFEPSKILKKPEDKDHLPYERLNDSLANLKQAVKDGDPKMANNNIRQAVQNAKDLIDKLRDPERKLPPYERQRNEQAANDLENLIPRLIKKGSPVMKNMNDQPAKEDLMDAINRLKRAADRGAKPKDERDLRDNFNNLRNGLNSTRQAAKDGKDVDPGLAAIKNALDNLRKTGDRMAERNPNPDSIRKPIADMEKLAEEYKKAAPLARKGDAAALKKMDDLIPKFEKAWDDLNKASRATDIAPIQDVEDSIDNVVAAVDLGEHDRIVPAGKDLKQKIADLGNHIENLPDPKARDQAKALYDQLQPGLVDLIKTAAEARQNPNKDYSNQMNDIANRMKDPLSQLKKTIDPKPYDRRPEGAGAAVKKALENLRKALDGGNPQEIRKALDDLRNAMGKYNDAAAEAAKNIDDPRKKALLDKEAQELRELADDLRRADPTDAHNIRMLMDSIPDSVDEWLDNFRSDERDDMIKALAKQQNLMATLGNISDEDMDLGDLLSTAGDLSNLMRGLIGNTAETARKLGANEKDLSPAARAALDLDKFLRQLEGNPIEEETTESVSLELPVSVDTHFEKIDLKKARTFDEVAAAVAYEIHERAKLISKEGDNVAMELANLARAARTGDKQAMLLAAKAAAAYMNTFCKQLTDLAAKIPGKNMAEKREQDNLIRYAQGLRNYATQLKILTSVKAASIEESKDTDASLSEMARGIGQVVGAALSSMQTTNSAILLKH